MLQPRFHETESRMRSTLALAVLLAILLACAYGVYTGRIVVPDEWNPWAPLRIEEPLNWLTRLKLERLSNDDSLCSSVLKQARICYQPIPDRETGPGCGFHNAVRIERTSLSIGEAFTLSCRSAVALALWELHVVHPAALAHFSERVVRVEHFGSYACRNVYGREDAPRSRHATADALDIAGFVLNGGRRISVERDWGSDDREGRFLRELHDGACRVFDSVFGPAYNAAHRDHFHLDRGGYRMCR
jgi:hypothetical protein